MALELADVPAVRVVAQVTEVERPWLTDLTVQESGRRRDVLVRQLEVARRRRRGRGPLSPPGD